MENPTPIENRIVSIDELKPADYNPRVIDSAELEKLKASIRHHGFVEPIVVNKDMTIIGGHQRVKAAREIGLMNIPAAVVDLPKDKERTLNLALNKISGGWDEEKLRAMLVAMSDEERRMAGFDQAEITKQLDAMMNPDEDDFDPDAQPIVNKAKMGEIYELGDHILMCGDSTDPAQVSTLMSARESVRAAMVFTDPPYNIAYEGGMNTTGQNKREMIMNDKMSTEDFFAFLAKVMKNLIDNCDGAMYVCMSSSELVSLKAAFEQAGGHYQSFIIWAKNTFTLSRSDWQNQYEPILYGWPSRVVNHYFVGHRNMGNVWDGIDTLMPTYADGKTTIKIGEYHLELDGEVTGKVLRKKDEVDIWKENKPTKSKEHPTMKPIVLVARALRASSLQGQTVLDLFGGSGSTLITCEKMGRKCRTMELDPQYVDVIIKRWETLTGRQATLLNGTTP